MDIIKLQTEKQVTNNRKELNMEAINIKNRKTKIAKAIRVITVPPVLVASLFITLLATGTEVFTSLSQTLLSFILLGLMPVMAYPMQKYIPSFKDKGREGQRKLAFIFTAISYTVAMIYGYASSVGAELQMIYNGYFISVMILCILNKLCKIKASGHACAIAGPMMYLIYLVGYNAVVPCVIVASVIVWSSLYLKRHSITDLLFGVLACLVGFVSALIIK